MKKYYTHLLLVILLLIEFAALDDITTGRENDFTGEWLTIIAVTTIYGWIIALRLKKVIKG